MIDLNHPGDSVNRPTLDSRLMRWVRPVEKPALKRGSAILVKQLHAGVSDEGERLLLGRTNFMA